MIDTRLDHTRVELQSGRALVEVLAPAKNERMEIQYGITTTEFKGAGLYRFDAGTGELQVFGGDAVVVAGGQKVTAGRGMAVHLDTGLSTSKFSVKKVDAFHRWAAGRSFYMFASSAESRARRTDWEYTPTGWFWNRKFGMKFYSGIAAAEYRRRLEQEERDHASFENIQKAY